LLGVAGVAVAVCSLLGSGEGPPPAGDWDIPSGDVVQLAGATLDLRGNLDVYGDLALNNCTLVVWSATDAPFAITVRAGGAMRCDGTRIAPSPGGGPFVMRAEAGSTLSVGGGSIVGAGRSGPEGGLDSGVFVRNDASFQGVLFDGCYAGVWASGAEATARGCTFVACEMGAVADEGGNLTLDDCDFVGCGIGAMATMTSLTVLHGTYERCPEPILSIGSQLLVRDARFEGFEGPGVGAYTSNASVDGCTFEGSTGEAVFAYLSYMAVSDCQFLGCRVGISATESFVRVAATRHLDADDEALYLRWSTFEVDGVSTSGCYWGLRTYASKGSCRNLTCRDSPIAAYIEQSDDVMLEHIDIRYGLEDVHEVGPRGIWTISSDVVVRDVSVVGVRTALNLEYTEGLVERVNASNLTHEGVLISLSEGLVLRHIRIVNATDGFRVNLWSDVAIEDSSAEACLSTGFNFTIGGYPRLYRCNASGCPVGMWSQASFPYLEDCEWYERDEWGHDYPDGIGLDCIGGGPRVYGGVATGGSWGMRFNASVASVKGVTFLGTTQQCVLFTCSTRDTVADCRFLGAPESTGAVVIVSSPALRGNLASGMRYGVLAMYDGSRVTVEGNTIENMSADGVLVLVGAEASLSGNTIRWCNGSALRVGIFGRADSLDDTFYSCTEALVYVHTGSSLDIRGASLTNCTIGVHAYDSPRLTVTFCQFIGLGRAIVAERLQGPSSVITSLDVLVEACYFANDSGYGVGVVNGELRVNGCTFIGNGAGVCAWNSSVELLDPVLVGNALYGLMVENGTASWTVTRLSRVIGSPISARADILVDGGALWVEETKVGLAIGGSFVARAGAAVHIRDVLWLAGGTSFMASCSTIELRNVLFEGVGSASSVPGGAEGVALSGSSLVAMNTTFKRARSGLVLTDCTASLLQCHILECTERGLAATRSHVEMSSCVIERIVGGRAAEVSATELVAGNTTFAFSSVGLRLSNGTAHLTDCSMGGTSDVSVGVEGGSAILMNTTYEPEMAWVGPGGRIVTWWYVSVTVSWANANELSLVTVRVDDPKGTSVANATADASGRAGPMPVLASEQTIEGLTIHGPHLVVARIHGYTALRSVMLQSSTTVSLSLEDADPPTITVYSPVDLETWSSNGTVQLIGRATDLGSGTATVVVVLDDGASTWTSQGDSFARTLQLTDGHHFILLRATDWAGLNASVVRSIWVETRPISLLVDEPMDGSATNATEVRVRGLVSRADVTVRVNGIRVELDGTAFSTMLRLDEGLNRIVVTAEDHYGHRAAWNVTVLADRTVPDLLLTTPRTVYTKEDHVLLEGILGEGARLRVNGETVLVQPGCFTVRCQLDLGETALTVEAVDDFGNTRSERVVAIRSEAQTAPRKADPMQAVPFVIIVPLVAVAEWYVMTRRASGGGSG